MPHQCVRCNRFYEDGSSELNLQKGCTVCGNKSFFFIKAKSVEEAKKEVAQLKLSSSDRDEIERSIFELLSSKLDTDHPVVLDLETVRVLKPGKYEIDLVQIFKGAPLIYKLEEGKYVIDLVESFRAAGKNKN